MLARQTGLPMDLHECFGWRGFFLESCCTNDRNLDPVMFINLDSVTARTVLESLQNNDINT